MDLPGQPFALTPREVELPGVETAQEAYEAVNRQAEDNDEPSFGTLRVAEGSKIDITIEGADLVFTVKIVHDPDAREAPQVQSSFLSALPPGLSLAILGQLADSIRGAYSQRSSRN